MTGKVICVTGNMASGKSTLAQTITQCLNEKHIPALYIPEPHLDNPFLPLYLEDQVRWGFTAQLRYYYDYARIFAETIGTVSDGYFIVDTGLWTNQWVYMKYLLDAGKVTADEAEFYQTLCDNIRHTYIVPEPSGYVFIEVTAEICWRRLHERGWDYQINGITRDYLDTLHGYFERMQQSVSDHTPTLLVSNEIQDFTKVENVASIIKWIEALGI
jgi:deoxyadenosine/deoxycytidine kinase